MTGECPTVLQACSDAVRFLDERKAGMMALLDRSVRDAMLQLEVHTPRQKPACMSCTVSCSWTVCGDGFMHCRAG